MRSINLGTFPYDSFASASKDNFKKLKGQDNVFAMLVRCWKQDGWRSDSQSRQKVKRAQMKLITEKMEQKAARLGLTIEEFLEKED